MQVTNYNKAAMQDLILAVQQKIEGVRLEKGRLKANVSLMKSSWIEGDADATAILSTIESEHDKLDKAMETALDIMTKFKDSIVGQVGRYEDAEGNIKRAIGS